MWPLDLRAAALDGVAPAADPSRHHFNGVDATGRQGTMPDLPDATGIDPAAAELDTFSFWVADGTDYIVELALIADGTVVDLRPLIGPEFDGVGQVTVSIRHRLFDLGTADPIAPQLIRRSAPPPRRGSSCAAEPGRPRRSPPPSRRR